MATLILVRHGRSTANTAGVLAGWTPGVHLDARGTAQAAALPRRLDGVPIAAAVSSPLERCVQTLTPLLDARPHLALRTDDRIGECHYGDWSGRKLGELSGEPLMAVVQQHPSAAVFPGGESLRAMQARAVDAVRDWNERVETAHGEDAVYVMCSHGDVIKALVADAIGLHLDLFQRIHVEPCSVTAIRYTRTRPFLLRLGDTGDLGDLAPRGGPEQGTDTGDAVVGGGAGAP
ncbi:histidine phosphatase family protein [Streptomyces clavuligerus]|uniref:Phosphatase n=1 Tax=Streptomyces clavuligerus TaxID=1901 RepID=E2PWD4_STRCL|nr:histidine phosphatase family protein [Streptomyces clavuligerus]ANW20967.1 phosphoglycerate mutase [Streptomyces clavuligerus]AXU15584.1 MSMEG_4193 family putative phosphomutase [Streptomyces clavuligerus]EFG05967.1 Phosphatase [Streptomyces clavuligerus]MBY6305695.1 MSMEG_4193 family putative phosphomutase [Streptomyces clavuligerus]QCS08363.1 MSMEG_4193 family putative phosphomutase [Streptomyces clavuligerus]